MARRGSLAASVADLEVGEAFSHSQVIPKEEVSAKTITELKRTMATTLSRTISRVRETYPLRKYRSETHHQIADELYAVVFIVVTREQDDCGL